jgi:hypothetical protein
MPVLTTRSADAAAAESGDDAFPGGGADGFAAAGARKPRRVASAVDLSNIDARSAALIRALDVSFSSLPRGAPASSPPALPRAPPMLVPPLAFAPPPVAGGAPWAGDVEACIVRLQSIGLPNTLLTSLRDRLMAGSAGAGSPLADADSCGGGSLSDDGGGCAAAYPPPLPF